MTSTRLRSYAPTSSAGSPRSACSSMASVPTPPSRSCGKPPPSIRSFVWRLAPRERARPGNTPCRRSAPTSLRRLMSAEPQPIGVIGTGYVGLVTAAGFAELGSDVWCVDIDAAKIEGLRRGEMPIYETGLAELLERNAARLHYSTDLAPALEHARLLFVAVGTPPTYSGDADLSAVHAVADGIPASTDHALVMKSTVPCGTRASLMRIVQEHGK